MADPDEHSAAVDEEIHSSALEALRVATDRGLSVATAESCTGGMLSSVLTDVEGLSGRFERGFVVYSPDSKCDLLGIDPDLIDDHGAVSRAVAIAMAKGALRHSLAHVAVSVTGYADEGDEPGLVHLACSQRAGKTTHLEKHFGPVGRDHVRQKAVVTALTMLTAALRIEPMRSPR